MVQCEQTDCVLGECSLPQLSEALCSVVAIVTVPLVVNVALIRWPCSRQLRTTGAAQVLVAFVHLLCTYSTVVLHC